MTSYDFVYTGEMLIGDILYFSPKYRFKDLGFEDPEGIIAAFRDRVNGFYLDAAEELLPARRAFAAGLLVCAAVDFVAATCTEEAPVVFLAKFLQIETQTAEKIWELFRHGLVHEGRVKPLGQFSFETGTAVEIAGDAVIVNPELLLRRFRDSFEHLCESMSPQRKKLTAYKLKRHFGREVELSRI
jgi:hypothetical protein